MKMRIRKPDDKQPKPVVEFWLEDTPSRICLKARVMGKDDEWFIVTLLKNNGKLFLDRCITDRLGLPLDGKGRIVIAETDE